MKIVKVKEVIFREYDIRGLYKSEINSNVSYTIGRSFSSYINDKTVIIGMDNRKSSPIIHKCLISGLLEGGANIIDLGLVTTPMYYCAKKKLKIKSGIMITASHNPKEYNGFKISFDLIGNAYGTKIKKFMNFTNKGIFTKGNGKIVNYDIKNEYLNLIKNSISLGSKKLNIVVDCGNGTGSIIIKEVLSMFDVNVKYLFCKSNGSFPNHEPDPSVRKNQVVLAKKVKSLKYDYGFSVDGDADRVGIVDEKGNILSSDLYLLLMYRYLSNKIKNKKAIYDVKCGKSLIDELDRLGYKQTMYRTGASYMNAKINKDKYDFGGEFSGHMWFRDKYPGFDDGIYSGLRVLEILSNTSNKLSELFDGINEYYATDEIKIKVSEYNKFDIVNSIKDYCDKMNYKYNEIDGIRVIFDDSWALIRASNTGPNLTIRFEATNKRRLDEVKNEFLDKVNKYK